MRVTASSARAAGVAMLLVFGQHCSSTSSSPAPAIPQVPGQIVVAISTAELTTMLPFQSIRVRVSLNGVSQEDKVLTLPVQGAEVLAEGVGFADIELTGLGAGGPNDVQWMRRAKAPFIPGEKRMFRPAIDPACFATTNVALACGTAQTCEFGRCVDPTLTAFDIPIYDPNWARTKPDPCRPLPPGDPQVIVGTGPATFTSVADGDELAVEAGPQGGHHVWIAVRSKNLATSGTSVSLSGRDPSNGAETPPTSFVFSLDEEKDGFCRLTGLRYQLDNGTVDYREFLGKPFDITVEMRDRFGTSAKTTLHAKLARTISGG